MESPLGQCLLLILVPLMTLSLLDISLAKWSCGILKQVLPSPSFLHLPSSLSHFVVGQLLKIMEDHKAPISATLFVDNNSYTILSADTTGIVNWTVFRKVFYYYIASTKTIIGLGYNNLPKYGLTRDLAFMKPTGFHRCDNYYLFAFASEKKVVITSCQNPESPFFYELTPPPNSQLSTPLISWRKVYLY